jgi:hypothetical protein
LRAQNNACVSWFSGCLYWSNRLRTACLYSCPHTWKVALGVFFKKRVRNRRMQKPADEVTNFAPPCRRSYPAVEMNEKRGFDIGYKPP